LLGALRNKKGSRSLAEERLVAGQELGPHEEAGLYKEVRYRWRQDGKDSTSGLHDRAPSITTAAWARGLRPQWAAAAGIASDTNAAPM